jgi:hypothetical protein
MDSTKLNRVEMLALIKTYNKSHDDKIKNVDKLKKDELVEICQKYSLLNTTEVHTRFIIDLRNISKKDLMRDVEIYFLKQSKMIPQDIVIMKKQDLINYMELNDITHYTPELIEKEVKRINREHHLKNIITYNIMRYDNIDIMQLDSDKIEEYIEENKLDTNIEHLHAYAVLLYNLHASYEGFCRSTGTEYIKDRIKTIPKILEHIKHL